MSNLSVFRTLVYNAYTIPIKAIKYSVGNFSVVEKLTEENQNLIMSSDGFRLGTMRDSTIAELSSFINTAKKNVWKLKVAYEFYQSNEIVKNIPNAM